MTAHQSGLSIDFGTSHTVGMLRLPDGRHESLLFDATPLLPSAVFVDGDGRLQTGRDAERSARLDPTAYEPNPKRRLADGTLLLGTHEVPVADAVTAVLDRVRSEAERTLGGPAGEVVLTHPASWAPIRRTLLADAAGAAGLGAPVLVPEPVAAATCFTAVLSHRVDPGAAVVVYDLGGGTFDVSVVRRTATSWDVVASDGFEDVGGVDLDAAVVGWVGRTAGGADPQRWQRLAAPETTADRRLRRQLQEDARIAKEQLSRANQTGLPVPLLDVDVHLTRGELEDLARPLLDRTVALTTATLFASGVTRDGLAGVFLVGGASRMPLVATLLHRALGVAPVALEQPELVVARGALSLLDPAPAAAVAQPETPASPAPAQAPGSPLPASDLAAPVSPAPMSLAPAVAPTEPAAAAVPPPAADPAASDTGPAPDAAPASDTGSASEAPPVSDAGPASEAPPTGDVTPAGGAGVAGDGRRRSWLLGAGALAAVLAVAALAAAAGRDSLVSGTRALAGPTAVLPMIGLLVLLTAGRPLPLPGSARPLLVRAASAGAGATLLYLMPALLLWSRAELPEFVDIRRIRGAGETLLLATVAGGVLLAVIGLTLLGRGRIGDPLGGPAGARGPLLWVCAGGIVAVAAQSYIHDRDAHIIASGGWTWTAREINPAVQLARAVLGEGLPAGPLNLLLFWAGATLMFLLVLGGGLLLRRGGEPGGPAPVAPVRIAAVLFTAGGVLAAVHGLQESDYWGRNNISSSPTRGILPAVHAVWNATVGLVPPGVFTTVVAVAVAGTAGLLVARRRRAQGL
ncbi:Hsp70 family protein [Dactylosporangium sp. NPDC049742]|uniref:Hsp70 family protein n=1 Tax=Dactylosporangium sp. NPDC049742 TaxID=3154737 RepID=UPI0034311B53